MVIYLALISMQYICIVSVDICEVKYIVYWNWKHGNTTHCKETHMDSEPSRVNMELLTVLQEKMQTVKFLKCFAVIGF